MNDGLNPDINMTAPRVSIQSPPPQKLLAIGFVGVGVLMVMQLSAVPQMTFKGNALFVIGLAMGVTLYHAVYSFTGAYRRFIVERDMSGITAQLVMLAVTIIAFAPLLNEGAVFGQRLGGAIAPVGVAMMFGAFLFGVGMQVAGGCASGTLFTVGGGSVRMMIVLVFFCAGTFLGSLHQPWWNTLPRFPAIALGREWGWGVATGVQLAMLLLIYAALRWMGGRNGDGLWFRGRAFSWRDLVHGPWPLLVAAVLLAGLNVATLLVAGHPWSVTWGYTLWGAKVATALGWDPASSAFWTASFPQRALDRSLLYDTVSLLNVGIILGAAMAASLAGRFRPVVKLSLTGLCSAVIGGLVLGYGARLAYGCNIGAFISGVASSSLHGWAWIVAAAAGNVLGVKLMDRVARS